MAKSDINSEDKLVQATFAEHLEKVLGWESAFAFNTETFGPDGTLGREDTREAVLKRDLRAAIARLNPLLPESAQQEAVAKLTRHDFSRSLLQHNQEFHGWLRDGVPVEYRDAAGQKRDGKARVIDFSKDGIANNRFLVVRELKLTGLRTPNYNRRADLVCFINGLPVVFIELKAVYKNIRTGFEQNLRDYMDENVIAHAFHHNAFLIVSNGHRARYGSITSTWEHFYEWKRLEEKDAGNVEAEVLLNGMLAKDRLLDLLENFVLFDASKPGQTRKIIGRNHQVLGVNQAVESVIQQEELKREYPPDKRLTQRQARWKPTVRAAEDTGTNPSLYAVAARQSQFEEDAVVMLDLIEQAHPQLGKLGVFWQTQGSGKSYSMIFFTEKVRRKVSAKFTFLLMTDRSDLDGQLYRSFVGCGAAPANTPRTGSGEQLKTLLQGNPSYVFSLIHKFNQDVDPSQPYSTRDDIIVISDEAHRTQGGKLALNMRLALPNASFLGFTGTPLFKYQHLTRRIFGGYVSRYDFKRSEEDGATVKLVYDNRGEKLKVARLDLNDRIAAVIDQADLDPDQESLIEKLLGKDYEVITAPKRLNKIARDFVEYASGRWESGKAMLVCVDKITCARMWKRIARMWKVKTARLRLEAASEPDTERRAALEARILWMEQTIIEIIISEAQNEVADFKKWGRNIIPHRERIKKGFETPDGRRVDVESAFKDPEHPFRIAVVCAMWLTGFDVECLSTLYIDKPMKAHTLMQAIARANRIYPGKDFGLIVDYNGMTKSLRAAMAQYALGDGEEATEEVAAPIEERVGALLQAITETESHLSVLGFDSTCLSGARGFAKIKGLADAVDAVYTNDDSRQRFQILAQLVFTRFKSLVMEPSIHQFAERHDNIEAIFKKLSERRDMADVTALLKELHRIVNQAIDTAEPGDDQRESLQYDLSKLDLEKLRDEFAKKVTRKATALQDVREIVESKLMRMLANNPLRMDYYRRYQEIVADYNREKDRITMEETFARLMDLAKGLDAEQSRAAEEHLSEEELALFDLLRKDGLKSAERERVKQASKSLLAAVQEVIRGMDLWTEKETTQSEVETVILDHLFTKLPSPPFDPQEIELAASRIYQHLWTIGKIDSHPGQAA